MRRTLLVLLALGALWTVCCFQTEGSAKRVFETVPEKPRPLMITLKAYRGSRNTTMNAAEALMRENPRFGEPAFAGTPNTTVDGEGEEPAFLASSIVLKNSTATVVELLQLMQAVNERFTPQPDIDPKHPALKLELWWVAGVHAKASGVELPSPLILDEQWANEFFAHGASGFAIDAAETGIEDTLWTKRVAIKFTLARGKPNGRSFLEGSGYTWELQEQDGVFSYSFWCEGEAEVLARVAELSYRIDVHHHRYVTEPGVRNASRDAQIGAIEDEVEERALSWFEPLTLALPSGLTLEQRAQKWLAAVRDAASKLRLAVRRVVVFDVEPQLVRGMLIGEKVEEGELVPRVELISPMEIVCYPDRECGVTLRVDVPKLEP